MATDKGKVSVTLPSGATATLEHADYDIKATTMPGDSEPLCGWIVANVDPEEILLQRKPATPHKSNHGGYEYDLSMLYGCLDSYQEWAEIFESVAEYCRAFYADIEVIAEAGEELRRQHIQETLGIAVGQPS